MYNLMSVRGKVCFVSSDEIISCVGSVVGKGPLWGWLVLQGLYFFLRLLLYVGLASFLAKKNLHYGTILYKILYI